MSTGANQLENNEQTLDNSFKSKYLRLKRKYESLINVCYNHRISSIILLNYHIQVFFWSI